MAFAPPLAVRKKRAAVAPDPYVAASTAALHGEHEAALLHFSQVIDGRRGNVGAGVYAARGASAQALGQHVRAVYDYSMAICALTLGVFHHAGCHLDTAGAWSARVEA